MLYVIDLFIWPANENDNPNLFDPQFKEGHLDPTL